jgi:hypothetical protein
MKNRSAGICTLQTVPGAIVSNAPVKKFLVLLALKQLDLHTMLRRRCLLTIK